MSQSDGRRRIKIQQLNLDPLSKWFMSRREIGTRYGKLQGQDPKYSSVFIVNQGPPFTEETYTINPAQDAMEFVLTPLI